MTQKNDTTNELPTSVMLLNEVADRLKKSSEQVREAVIEARVKAEVEKRSALLESALVVREELIAEVKKASVADIKYFDKDGNAVVEYLSESALKKLKEKQEKLSKVDKSIQAALSENQWDQLKNLKV